MATIRQQLKELLQEDQWNALDLSRELSIREKEVYDHLEHLRRSSGGRKMHVSPYHCLSCNYIFTKRKRLDRPGRCPSCKGSHIGMATFSMAD